MIIQLKPTHQGFKANADTSELNTTAHQKHAPTTKSVQCGPVLSGAVNSHTRRTKLGATCITSYCSPGVVPQNSLWTLREEPETSVSVLISATRINLVHFCCAQPLVNSRHSLKCQM